MPRFLLLQAFKFQIHLSELGALFIELFVCLNELIVLAFNLFILQLFGSNRRVKIRDAFNKFVRVSFLARKGFETFLFGLELGNPVLAQGLDRI